MDIFHHITEIPNPPQNVYILQPRASLRPRGVGVRMEPVISSSNHLGGPGKAADGESHREQLTSLLICWKWTKPKLRWSGAPADETWGVPSLWCGATQEEAPCAKFITVKMQLCLTSAAAADLFLSGACVNSEFLTFLVKAKHLNCVQPVWPFIVSIYNKKESRLKT